MGWRGFPLGRRDGGGAHLIAVDRHTGDLRWITQVDAHPAAVITGSPVVHENTVYVGVSSQEEGLAANPAYPCCTFRGSMVALDVFTGNILWKTFTVPDNGGLTNQYSGNAIWSPPAIDPGRGSPDIGVGNNYTVPDDVLQCQEEAIDSGNHNANCEAPDDFFDTVLALDLKTGAIKWSNRLFGFDPWTVACLSLPPGVNCPSPHGPDFDFPGSGQNLLHLSDDGPRGRGRGCQPEGRIQCRSCRHRTEERRLLGAQSGHRRDRLEHHRRPRRHYGGIQWGTAIYGTRIYVAITNALHMTYTLANGGPDDPQPGARGRLSIHGPAKSRGSSRIRRRAQSTPAR